jgi:DNA-directed RNA polymerase specialized sigma subunit
MADEPLTPEELTTLLVNHLHHLPKSERLVLYRALGVTGRPLSQRAIARELGITEKQVVALLTRGVRRLRFLRDRGAIPFDPGLPHPVVSLYEGEGVWNG